MNVIFNFMKCKSLVTRSVVFNNPEISCAQKDYLFIKWWFIYPSFILWIVLFPLTILIGMRTMKSKYGLSHVKTRLLFGFVYLGYAEANYFWEFTKIFLRIGMQLNYELITE